MSQNYTYPPGFSTSINPSIGINGAPAPTSSTEIGGINPSNNLTALKVDASGNLLVNVATTTTTPLPTTDLADGPVTPGTVATRSILGGVQFNTVLPTLTTGQQSAIQADSSGRLIVSPLASTSTVTVVQPTGSNLHVQVDASALPTGASTSALQTALNAQIPTTLGQKTSANSLAVVVASDQSAVPVSQSGTWNINNISGTVSLPTGASTSALQTQISGQLPATLGAHVTAASVAVNIASDQSAVPVSQSGTWNINNISGTVSLPTGAATAANQVILAAQFPATLGQKTSAGSLGVVLASDQSVVPTSSTAKGNAPLQFVRNDYTSVNVTTAAYTQLIASTSGITNVLEIFDSSGQTLKIAFGGSGSEVDQFIVYPGGNGRITCTIAASTRISIKALSATANAGEIDINLYT